MKRRGPRRAKVDRIGKMMRDPERGAEFRRRFGEARLWARAEAAYDDLVLHGARYEDLEALREMAIAQYGDETGYLRLLILLDRRRRERGVRVGDSPDPIAEMRRYYTDVEIREYLRRKYNGSTTDYRRVFAGEIAA